MRLKQRTRWERLIRFAWRRRIGDARGLAFRQPRKRWRRHPKRRTIVWAPAQRDWLRYSWRVRAASPRFRAVTGGAFFYVVLRGRRTSRASASRFADYYIVNERRL